MSFLDWNNFNECVNDMEEQGYDKEEAERICGSLQEEHEERGEEAAESLKDKILDKADAIIDELELRMFSFVDEPAQPSKFVMMKSDDEDDYEWKSTAPIVKEIGEDWNTVYGAVMVPGVVDKQGDVISAEAIKEAAHKFVQEGNTDSIDADHDMISGQGKLSESWLLKEDTEYELPDGGTKEYPKGTWMTGVEPSDELKERIIDGEILGFSIYGKSDKIMLNKSEDDIMDKDEVKEIFESTLDEYSGNAEKLEKMNETLEEIKENLVEADEPEKQEDDEEEKSALEKLEESIKAIDPDEVDFRNLDALIADLMPEGIGVDDVTESLSDLRDDFVNQDEEIESDNDDEEDAEDTEEDKEEEKDEDNEEDEEKSVEEEESPKRKAVDEKIDEDKNDSNARTMGEIIKARKYN